MGPSSIDTFSARERRGKTLISDKWGNERLNRFDKYEGRILEGSRILVVVGSLSISGGTNLILQYAAALRDSGADVVVAYMLGNNTDARWHPQCQSFEFKHIRTVQNDFFDLTVLTWWRTVYEVPKIKSAKFLYFVQSLESRFALNHEDIRNESLAAATYTLGIPMAAVAKWIQNLIMSMTHSPVWYVPNGIDKQIFPLARSSVANRGPRPLRVLVEGHSGVPMKAVDEAISVAVGVEGVETWHVSPSKGGGDKRAHRIFEAVPLVDMHKIYEEADVLLKLSRVEGMFGPPLEMFHAGKTAVVSRVTGYSEYIVHNSNALAVDVDDFASARHYLELLAQDGELLSRLSKGALDTAESWPSIAETSKVFVHVCWLQLTSNYRGTHLGQQVSKIEKEIKTQARGGGNPNILFDPNLVSN